MAEIFDGNKTPKIIAFYLPQYHSIPENDKWWGKGFTEWANVKKAKPLYNGHDQPKIPLGHNYYNLLDDETKIWQAELAKEYKIYGFCYYHYWFKDGKKLLEKPAEQMLLNKKVDIPFCFSWANENWSRNWDGGNREIIIQQDYGDRRDWQRHLAYLIPFFKDERYIKVHGKPLFIIYKPEQIVKLHEMLAYFRNNIKKYGFEDLCLAFQFPQYYTDMYYDDAEFDYRIAFEPVYSRSFFNSRPGTAAKVKTIRKLFGEKPIEVYRSKHSVRTTYGFNQSKYLTVYYYDEVWKKILSEKWDEKLLPGGFVDWDNTPRNIHGLLHFHFTIESFKRYFEALVKRAKEAEKPIIFMNAWNEWGEGAFLEPDEKYQYQKLEAIRDVMGRYED